MSVKCRLEAVFARPVAIPPIFSRDNRFVVRRNILKVTQQFCLTIQCAGGVCWQHILVIIILFYFDIMFHINLNPWTRCHEGDQNTLLSSLFSLKSFIRISPKVHSHTFFVKLVYEAYAFPVWWALIIMHHLHSHQLHQHQHLHL